MIETMLQMAEARTLILGRVRWWYVPILFFLALATWSIASPVGSSPDDDFHLSSIWCGDGIRSGICEAGSNSDERRVPHDILVANCYAGHPTESAACQVSSASDGLSTTTRGNFNGHLYPPIYYAAMGLLVTPDIDASVILMRIVNCLLFTGLATALFRLLPRRRRPALVGGIALSTIPLGLFVISSVNPSGWAVLSAATLWIALVGYYETQGPQRVGLAIVATLSTIIGAGARSDAALYVFVAVAVAVVLTIRRSRGFLLASILPLGLLVVAGFLYLSGSQSAAGSTGLSGGVTPSPAAVRGLVLTNILNIPDLWAGIWGRWGLGWLDTPMPAIVWFFGIGAFSVAMAVGLRNSSPRKILALAGVTAAAVLVPLVLLVQTQATVGSYVQPRYVLPLLVILAGVALHDAGRGWPRPTRLQLAIGIGMLATAQAVALYANIRRYVTGIDVTSINLNTGVEWWWAGAPGPMYAWILAVLVFTAAIVGACSPVWRGVIRSGELDTTTR
jgi:hypothetical protein